MTGGRSNASNTTAPPAPSDLAVSGDGASIPGSGEPGAAATIRGPNGAVLATGTVGSDGAFTLPLSPPLIDREMVAAVQTDPAGMSAWKRPSEKDSGR